MGKNKSVKNMTREELVNHAKSVAQHSNKTLREFEKAGKTFLSTHSKLTEIAEKNNLLTSAGRVSRSDKKFGEMTDNQLRHFITSTKKAYTGNTVKTATEQFTRQKNTTVDMIKNRVPNADVESVAKLTDEQMIELFSRLNSAKKSNAKDYVSGEVLIEFLKDVNMYQDFEDDMSKVFRRQREAQERMNKNRVTNRNRGRIR